MLSDDLSNMCLWLEARYARGDGLTHAETESLFANLLETLIRADILECGAIPRSMRDEVELRCFPANVIQLSDRKIKEAGQCSTRA